MIVTLTPNPSIDRAITIPALDRGQVIRATSSRIDPGGKGVNVARAVIAQGGASLAVLPSGGPEGHLMAELLVVAGVPFRTVPVAGSLRMNVSVLEPDGTTTKLNEPGPALGPAEVEALLTTTLDAAALAAAGPQSWIVGCGSLPPGAPADLYAVLVARARGRGLRVAIDSSGAPLVSAVAARPHLIKPNREELEELVDQPLHTLGDVRDAAQHLVAAGVETVAVSLGRDGALLVTAQDTIYARATIAKPRSTVAAGDCLLAGLLHSLAAGGSAHAALAAAVTWGAAAVTLPGSEVPTPGDLVGIPVEVTTTPDFVTPLTD